MPRFVLEIGTEEIPPRYFPSALASLYAGGEAMLGRARLGCGEAKVYGTPRRLAFIAEGLAAAQAPHTREERGPSARVAFDADGKPTKAAIGFARRHGLPPEKLERRQTDQGEYVFAIIQEPELPAGEALAPLLPGLITSISFPKAMRWGAGALRFGRPIRWLLALLDDQVVEFELEGIRSGRLTRGHPTLDDGMHPVTHAERYEDALKSHYIIVDPTERRDEVNRQIGRIAKDHGGWLVGTGVTPYRELELLLREPEEFAYQMATNLELQTTFLVEWPTAALGEFEKRFLELPRAVLETEMQHVQSYFPLASRDNRNELLPAFIAVRDGGEEHLDKVVAGWENVLRAKLIDASYFYEQDLKVALAERVEALRGVVFHEQLGTMYDKTQRVRLVARAAAAQMPAGDPVDEALLDRAAYLCKADLTTEMVTELSDLQGVMGGEYASRSREPEDVATAIAEHYRPRSMDDGTPGSPLARLLAIADKLDTITACFAVGIVPTGSADPYGLRREGTGVVRIAVEGKVHLSSSELVRVALAAVQEQTGTERPGEQLQEEVLAFLRQRLETYLERERPGGPAIRYDLVNAALAAGCDDLFDASERALVLADLAGSDRHFLPTVIASTRVSNIVKGFEGSEVGVDPKLFQHESETALWKAYQQALGEADAAVQRGDYRGLFQLFHALRAPIDRYFDDVLVMAADGKLRRNRLATCWHINQLFRQLADFTLVVQV
jgi:glycyl-tRNA synthetase beta chain